MGARLVQLDDDGRRVATVRLGPDELVIGRDAQEADLVVEQSTRVSRRHAAVRPVAGGYEIVDLGSANGTTVNGDPVERFPVALEDGDRVALGGDVELLFEIARSGRTIGSIALVLMLGASMAGGFWWWRGHRPDPVMQKAAQLAAEGVTAHEAGNPEMAEQSFQSAAGLLFREGRLDDVERDVLMRTAMDRVGAKLGSGVDLWVVFKQTTLELAKQRQIEQQQQESRGARTGTTTKPHCHLDAVGPAEYDSCLRQWVRQVLRDLRQEPKQDLPENFIAAIALEQCEMRDFFRLSLERGRDLVPMMEVELEKKYLPRKIHYLSLIESGYQPRMTGPAGAQGLWHGTAKDYDLGISGSDERTDPVKSTRAAAEYLRQRLLEFGSDDLLLALASYSTGKANVFKALRKLEDPFSERTYWTLVERNLLQPETKEYVAKFLAAAAAGEGGLPSMATLEEALHRKCKD